MLRRRAAISSLALALPAAALLTWVSDRWRAADAAATLERVVRAQVNEQVRERCESDPTWFLTGPLEGRPPRGVPDPNPDVLPPRPKALPQPFELFAYDEEFVGSSPASPRFPDDFKRALRRETKPVSGQFDTDAGTGAQFVVPTGWVGTTCMYFLGRMRPPVGSAVTPVVDVRRHLRRLCGAWVAGDGADDQAGAPVVARRHVGCA